MCRLLWACPSQIGALVAPFFAAAPSWEVFLSLFAWHLMGSADCLHFQLSRSLSFPLARFPARFWVCRRRHFPCRSSAHARPTAGCRIPRALLLHSSQLLHFPQKHFKPCFLNCAGAMLWALFAFVIIVWPHLCQAISYRCEGDQVLIVQSFGNDSIRMHCQRLHLCGHKAVHCQYEADQAACGGKNNFVAHVKQPQPLAPVVHTCCELLPALPGAASREPPPGIPGHEGNDCFVYELPDGSSPPESGENSKKSKEAGRKETEAAGNEDEQFTVLNSVDQIPSQFGDQPGQIGYRMRLFLLRNKSPPVLLVKAIQRVKDGYRVTICRPRCDQRLKQASKENGRDKDKSSEEWAAAAWSSWTSTSWRSWRTNTWAANNGTKGDNGRGKSRNGSIEAEASAESEGGGSGQGQVGGAGNNGLPVVNNVNVSVVSLGGQGGQGGNGGLAVGNANLTGGTGVGIGRLAANNGSGTAESGNGDGDEDKEGKGNENGIEEGKGGSGRKAGKHNGKDGDGSDDDDNSEDEGSEDASGDGGGGKGKKDHAKKKKEGKRKGGGGGGGSGSDEKEEKSGDDEDEDDDSEEAGDGKRRKQNGKNNGKGGRKGGKGKGGGGSGGDKSDVEDGDEENEEKEDKAGGGKIDGNGKGHRKGKKGRTHKGKEDLARGKDSKEELPIHGKTPSHGKGKDGDGHGNATGGTDRKVTVDGGRSGSGGEDSEASSSNESEEGKEEKGKKGGKDGDGDGGNSRSDSAADSKEPIAEGSAESGKNGTRKGGKEGGSSELEGSAGKSEEEEKRRKEKGKTDVDEHGKESNATAPVDERLAKGNRTKVDNRLGSAEGNGTLGRELAKNRTEVAGSVEKASGSASDEEGSKPDGGNTEDKSVESKHHRHHHTTSSTSTSTSTSTTTSSTTTTSTTTTTSSTHGGGGGGHTTTQPPTTTETTANPSPGGGGGPAPTGGGGGSPPEHGGAPPPAGPQPAVQKAETAPAAPGPAAAPAPQPAANTNPQPAAVPASPQMDAVGAMMRSCFSADTLVQTVQGPIRMDHLEVGDMVLVPASGGSMKFERVEMFYHRQPDAYTFFLQIETETGRSLSLTPLHLLPFGNCSEMRSVQLDLDVLEQWLHRSRFAHKATVGQCVFTMDSEDSGKIGVERIHKIGRRYSKGIYSPVTVEGSLLTNGILTSCFSQIESHSVQKLSFDILVSMYRFFGYLTDFAERTAVYQEIPSLLDFFHTLSRYIVPFAKY